MWLNLYIFLTSVLLEAQVKTELPGQQEVLSTNTMYKTKQQVLQWKKQTPHCIIYKEYLWEKSGSYMRFDGKYTRDKETDS